MIGITNPVQQASSTLATTQAHAANAAGGAFGSASVAKMPTQSELIADMQEEISFAHSEKTEEKEIEEEDGEDFYKDIYAHLIEQVEQEYPANDPEHKDSSEQFMRFLQNSPPRDQEELERGLGDITEDAGEAFALLARASAAPKGLGEGVQALLRQSVETLTTQNHERIQAGLNTARLARETEAQGGGKTQALQKTYQDMVSDYTGILPALGKLIETNSVQGFAENTSFLMRAAQKDLSSERTSTQPERLKRILSEFQGIKIFNTLREWAQGITTRFAQQFSKLPRFERDAFFGRCLTLLMQPENFNGLIRSPLDALKPADRVLVLQELRSGIRNLPNYLFPDSDAAKTRILFPVQSEIDHLVFDLDA